MNSKDTSAKKQKFIKDLKAFLKSIGIGVLQGSISAGIAFLMTLINDYALFGVLAIWLIFGWLSTFLIYLRTMEILTVVLSGALSSMLFYYLEKIPIWFSSIIVGLSILIWTISFVTKILLYPKKITQ